MNRGDKKRPPQNFSLCEPPEPGASQPDVPSWVVGIHADSDANGKITSAGQSAESSPIIRCGRPDITDARMAFRDHLEETGQVLRKHVVILVVYKVLDIHMVLGCLHTPLLSV